METSSMEDGLSRETQSSSSGSSGLSPWRSNPTPLAMWRKVLTDCVRGNAPDLSARQMALLLAVYMDDRPHTVRGLAADLKVSKPAISRALDRLGELGYVQRQRDDEDRRSVLVMRTEGGENFLNDFAALVSTALRAAVVTSMSDETLAPAQETTEKPAATNVA